MRGGANTVKEQVLIAAFPESTVPEVHVARLDLQLQELCFQEASVLASGGISLGAQREVKLIDVSSVHAGDKSLTLLDHREEELVQLHFENVEDQRVWGDGLKTAVERGRTRSDKGFRSPESTGNVRESTPAEVKDTDGQVNLLMARSQQLQNRIGALELISDRRDKQLQKMLCRLDGSMQMLAAVEDMCTQQSKVIQAQKKAILELRHDCCIEEDDGAGLDKDSSTSLKANQSKASHAKEALIEEPATGVPTQAQMLKLLQQADEMQQAFTMIKGLQSACTGMPETGADAMTPLGSGSQESVVRTSDIQKHSSKSAGDDEDAETILNHMRALSAEEESLQGMLRQSQLERDDLLKRLDDMKSLMKSRGIPTTLGSSEEEGHRTDSDSD